MSRRLPAVNVRKGNLVEIHVASCETNPLLLRKLLCYLHKFAEKYTLIATVFLVQVSIIWQQFAMSDFKPYLPICSSAGWYKMSFRYESFMRMYVTLITLQ